MKKRRLFRDGKTVGADVRTIDLLVCLLRAAPKWVDKNDLLDRLWPDQEITDWALSRLISDTRKLLGDDGDNQRIIRTIRGRGFQFSGDFKRLSPSETPLPEAGTVDQPLPVSKTELLKYLLMGGLILMALGAVSYYFFYPTAERPEVTGLINLSSSVTPWLDDILEDWALSQNNIILIKGKMRDDNIGLFNQYCGRAKCNQLIVIMMHKHDKSLSLHYQVVSDGIKEEERELISINQPFLISALRDVVANTMNRSSDYFPLPAAIFVHYSDHIYQNMYQIHMNLENTYVTFLAQERRRDELVKLITERLGIKRTQEYEKFFITYYGQMNKQEKFIFDQIRAMTSGTLYQCNRNILTLLESDPVLTREVPKLDDVRKHLAFWINKYHNIFLGRRDMSLLYVGVEDGVPFPSGVDQQVSAWLKSHQKNKIRP